MAAEGHDIVLIDKNEHVVERLIGSTDIAGIVGNGANLELLREAGVPGCDVFIAVTATDEINIIASIIAKKLGAKTTLVRVRNPEYSSNLEFALERLEFSMMVNPELETARAIAQNIRFPSALGIETFADERVQLVAVRVAKDSLLVKMPLSEFRKIYGSVLVCVVERGEDVFIPDGSFVLKEGDLIHVTGQIKDLYMIYKVAGCLTRKIRSIMIIGGSRITRYLLKIFEQSGMEICVIENDAARTDELAGDFPKVKVITGDGTDQTILEEQHIGHYNCFIALTGIDEENIVTSLYAAKKKVPKIVTKVNRKAIA